jgi:hypothetical protein
MASFTLASDYDVPADKLHKKSQSQTLVPVSSASTGGSVLWDLTHGVYLDYEPSGRYSSLVTLLHGLGFSVQTTSSGLQNVDLSDFDILVICLESAWFEAYTAGEVSAIKTFVQEGGGLLIMGENTSGPNGNINPVANAFGATCGVSFIWPFDLHITDLSTHPIFLKVSEIYFRSAGEITVQSPSELVANYDDFGVASAAEIDDGKVVVLGDSNCWDNMYINNTDNQLFAENTFKWLVTRKTLPVTIDIKPRSCENPVNVKSKGVLPVAIIGTEDFDVSTIDPSTIRICLGSDIGVSPTRWSMEDVSMPFEGDPCECHEAKKDGHNDLMLKFPTQEVVGRLALRSYSGQTVPIIISGSLKRDRGGNSIEGQDCLKILKKGK